MYRWVAIILLTLASVLGCGGGTGNDSGSFSAPINHNSPVQTKDTVDSHIVDSSAVSSISAVNPGLGEARPTEPDIGSSDEFEETPQMVTSPDIPSSSNSSQEIESQTEQPVDEANSQSSPPKSGSSEPDSAQPNELQVEPNAQNIENTVVSGDTPKDLGVLKAIPFATGFGTQTTGGRGGNICIVSSLLDTGPGTLRSCIDLEGPRTIIFEIGGTIEVSTPLRLKNPYVSIFGQTALGDGILLRASLNSKLAPLLIETHDVVIQHMRIRAGTSREITCCRDSLSIGSSNPGNVYNIVLDHNSITWGSDEIVDVWYDSHDITFSNNLIGESLHDSGSNDEGPAGRGLLIGSNGAHSITVHRNLIAHSYQRNPLIKTSGIVDVSNNLIYHWVSRGGIQTSVYESQQVNWVKNKWIALTGMDDSSQNSSINWGDILLTDGGHELEVFFDSNLGTHRTSHEQSEWALAFTDWSEPYQPSLNYHSTTRFPAPALVEIMPEDLETNLLPTVGAILPLRDQVDERIIDQVIERYGKMPNCVAEDDRPGEARCLNNVGGWPIMKNGETRLDTDEDGIPDIWETTYGLDPNVFDSLKVADDQGWTYLEHWIHSLE